MKKLLSLIALMVFTVAGCDRKDESVAPASAASQNFTTTEKTGHFVINPQFNGAQPFSEGLAPVLIGDDKIRKWGFISR